MRNGPLGPLERGVFASSVYEEEDKGGEITLIERGERSGKDIFLGIIPFCEHIIHPILN